MVNITFPDNSIKKFEKGITGLEIAKSISNSLAKSMFALKLNDEVALKNIAKECLSSIYILRPTEIIGSNSLNARKLVKSRITQDKKLEQGQILSPCRKKALIELSKGTNSQDKAWALRNIAILMQNGISFDGIQIKNETGVKNK